MPKPILLVEDSPDDLELILRALAMTCIANDVVTVGDGEQALAYLRREGTYAGRLPGNPAVVLLDLKLPKIGGLEVLKSIKADPDLKSIPVVMLTSSNGQEDLTRAYQLKANAYVVKPTDLTEFVRAVRELCLFWGAFNEPPPGSRRSHLRPPSVIQPA